MKMRLYALFSFLILMVMLGTTGCQHSAERDTDQTAKTSQQEFKFTRGGAPVEVIMRMSQADLSLTDFLTVSLDLRFKEGVKVIPPYLSESVYGPLLLVENPRGETFWSEKEEMMVNRWRYRFEPIVSGEFTLKPFTVNFRLEKERTDDLEKWPVYHIETDPIPYTVHAISSEELKEIRDITGLIYPPYHYLVPALTLTGIIIISAAGILFIRYGRNRSTPGNQGDAAINHFQQALDRLQELEDRDLFNMTDFNNFHTELASILRDYLQLHLGFRAKEQTTQEFIGEIFQNEQFTPKQRQELQHYLQLADLVKFATFQPGSQISGEALNTVRAFIQSTGSSNEV